MDHIPLLWEAEVLAHGLDLASVVESWPDLPEPVRAGILAMVRAIIAGSRG